MIIDFAKHGKVNYERGHIPGQGRVVRIQGSEKKRQRSIKTELSQIKYGPQLWTMS